MFQLSVLLPSAPKNKAKREQFLYNLSLTIKNPASIEIVICLDATDIHPHGSIERLGKYKNMVYTYSNPSPYRGTFFNQAWKASTGRFLLMANDDILFKTEGWDKLIPYDKYPDDLVMFYFKDNEFNHIFACHPIWSRKAMEMADGLFDPPYWITKCDNTIWDMHPAVRRHYLPEIEIEHNQEKYGPEWQPMYEWDNRLYFDLKNVNKRSLVYRKIMEAIGMAESRVLIGICTAEMARRADFYDFVNSLEKPPNTVQMTVHGQSIAFNRNQVVEAALVHNCSHIFFLDDDVICHPKTLLQLLSHDKDIVCGLQLKRNYPHRPLAYDDSENPVQLAPNIKGLIPIYSAGLGACLIKTKVFKEMSAPYFRLGQLTQDLMEEDTHFFLRAGQRGFKAYCDTDTRMGHIATMSVWPEYMDNRWCTIYDTHGEGRAVITQLVKEKIDAETTTV